MLTRFVEQVHPLQRQFYIVVDLVRHARLKNGRVFNKAKVLRRIDELLEETAPIFHDPLQVQFTNIVIRLRIRRMRRQTGQVGWRDQSAQLRRQPVSTKINGCAIGVSSKLDWFPESGPLNQLVSASIKELKNGQKSETRRDYCKAA